MAKITDFCSKNDKKTMSKAMWVGDFRLQRYGFYLHDDLSLEGVAGGDAEVRLNLVLTLKGGGLKIPVRKHYVKVSNPPPEKVSNADFELFKTAFDVCALIGKSTTLNMKDCLDTTSLPNLYEMKNLLDSKATLANKMHILHEHTNYNKGIQVVQGKLIATVEALREMVKKDLEERCEDDLNKIKMLVSNAIAVQEAFAKRQATTMSD